MLDTPRPISVVIATRNRGPSIDLTIRSLLACTGVDAEIVIVDQSTDDGTEHAVRPFVDEGAPITYVRSEQTGQSRAINEALTHARHDLVAMTDDDCEVPADWLSTLVDVFDEHPDVGVVFCAVDAADHDATAGWIPDYPCEGEHLATRWYHRLGHRGMGAGMAARASVLDEIGGFDTELGVGTPLPAGNDLDVAIRAMIAGWQVLETDRTRTIHHGFRTMEEGRKVTAGWIGMGAMYAKLVRTGHPEYAALGIWDVWTLSVVPALGDVARRRKPRDLRRLAYFAQGVVKGLTPPVDRDRATFDPIPEVSS